MGIHFKPVGEKILVKHLPPQKEGTIFLPEKTTDRRRGTREIPAFLAEVVAVGSLKEASLKPGDKVQVNPYSGTEIRLGGRLYVLYRESDLLAAVLN